MQLSSKLTQAARGGLALLLLAALLPAGGAAVAMAPQETNAAPVANNDNMVAFTNEGFQDFYILDNDTDADLDQLTLVEVTPAQHGAVGCCFESGTFYFAVYKPFDGYSGTDWFTYTVKDSGGLTDTATVNINVGPSGTVSSGRVAIHGGPQDRLTLVITPKAGATGPTAGTCTGGSGIGIEDAVIEPGNTSYGEAFDNGLTFFINNTQLPAHFPLSVGHDYIASGPHALEGFNLGLQYYAAQQDFTLRTVLAVTNPSGVTKNVTVTVATNLGGNAQFVKETSSGDDTFNSGDRWVVTTSDDTDPFYIVDTHVFYGPGAAEPPDLATPNVFGCNGDEGVRARFKLSIPAGGTQRLLFFNQFHDDNAAAVGDAAVFNGTPLAYLQGLSNNQLSTVVNWSIPPVSRLFAPLVER